MLELNYWPLKTFALICFSIRLSFLRTIGVNQVNGQVEIGEMHHLSNLAPIDALLHQLVANLM